MIQKQPWMMRAGEYPRSDAEYFALLARAVFSAGLGPRVVASRWENMEEAFCGFQPEEVCKMDEADVSRLVVDPKIIRNRRKIEAVIKNASVFLDCLGEHKTFHKYLINLGASSNLDEAAEGLSKVFIHMGRVSAMFFLLSAGWRPQESV